MNVLAHVPVSQPRAEADVEPISRPIRRERGHGATGEGSPPKDDTKATEHAEGEDVTTLRDESNRRPGRPSPRRRIRTAAVWALEVFAALAGAVGPPARGMATAAPRALAKSLRFAVIGDTGTGEAPQLAVARQMAAEYEREKYELVLMLGDNIYTGRFRDIGRVFETPYKPLLDRGVRFYSFAPAGDLVEFFTVDTTPIVEGRMLEQLAWLDKELSDSKARWKIAFFHHPPYSPGRRHGDDPAMLARVVPILERRGVRVVLSGHEHFFAKLRPKNGIEYVISGSGGKIHTGGLLPNHPNLESGNDRLHHFLAAELTEEALSFRAIGENGQVLYQGTIPRSAAKSAGGSPK
jgi:hypothetical protein